MLAPWVVVSTANPPPTVVMFVLPLSTGTGPPYAASAYGPLKVVTALGGNCTNRRPVSYTVARVCGTGPLTTLPKRCCEMPNACPSSRSMGATPLALNTAPLKVAGLM